MYVMDFTKTATEKGRRLIRSSNSDSSSNARGIAMAIPMTRPMTETIPVSMNS